MALNTHQAMVAVSSELMKLDRERIKIGKDVDYETLREAMVDMHAAWQWFIRTVREDLGLRKQRVAAIQLAAVSMKLCTDVRTQREKTPRIEHESDDEAD